MLNEEKSRRQCRPWRLAGGDGCETALAPQAGVVAVLVITYTGKSFVRYLT
jgi:hypothetical protein